MKKIAMLTMCLGIGLFSVLTLGGCGEGGSSASTTEVSADGRCEHQIKADTCPFCNPELVNAEGFCGAHGFPEAICAQCKPGIKIAFRAKGDWCDEHKLPESQCITCNPELAENIQEGVHGGAMPTAGADDAGNCEHGIPGAKCPFCDPSLIESEGFCNGHDVAEALCVQCRPFMKTAFVAAGDWCEQHNTPESQCAICNP
jgi:membrane fusion protein, heavy metal efflux system